MNKYMTNPNTHNRLIAGSNPAEPTSEANTLQLTHLFFPNTFAVEVLV